jgi:CheY-like chemotaxis protein
MARVLIIEDEVPLRRLLRCTLEKVGHTVLDAPDGRQGMMLWCNKPCDVVVTDIYMPEKDGMEVLREMNQVAVKPKIIAMSGGAQRGWFDWRRAAVALGADRVLMKPFDPQTLLETVQEVLDE